MGIREVKCGSNNWTELTKSRIRRWEFANKIMAFWVSQNNKFIDQTSNYYIFKEDSIPGTFCHIDLLGARKTQSIYTKMELYVPTPSNTFKYLNVVL
jgi:hypothetical protein